MLAPSTLSAPSRARSASGAARTRGDSRPRGACVGGPVCSTARAAEPSRTKRQRRRSDSRRRPPPSPWRNAARGQRRAGRGPLARAPRYHLAARPAHLPCARACLPFSARGPSRGGPGFRPAFGRTVAGARTHAPGRSGSFSAAYWILNAGVVRVRWAVRSFVGVEVG